MKRTFTLAALFVSFLAYGQNFGLIDFDLTKAEEGYILLSPNSDTKSYLINNCGELVYQWEGSTRTGLNTYLMENGNLLRTGQPDSFVLEGGGAGGLLEIIAPDGSLVWSYQLSDANFRLHHDVEVLPNGNLLVLAWELISETDAIAAGMPANLIAEQGLLVEKIMEWEIIGSDQINTVWEWRSWEHTVQNLDNSLPNFGEPSENPGKIKLNHSANIPQDWLHFNSIDYNAERDEIIVSARAVSEFWIIDHSTTTAEAATSQGGNSGKGGEILCRIGNPESFDGGTDEDRSLYRQHDARWIETGFPGEGGITVYNNGPTRPEGDYSTVDVFRPVLNPDGSYAPMDQQPTMPEWTYQADPDPFEFWSVRISGTARLRNGNTLICEGLDGRIFEVTEDKEIVWEYVNPVFDGFPIEAGSTTQTTGSAVFQAHRYTPDYPGLAFLDLVAGDPLELNPPDLGCVLETPNTEILPEDFVIISPNPTTDRIEIQVEQSSNLSISDISGKQLLNTEIPSGTSSLFLGNFSSGVYFVRFETEGAFLTKKLIIQ